MVLVGDIHHNNSNIRVDSSKGEDILANTNNNSMEVNTVVSSTEANTNKIIKTQRLKLP